MQSLLAAALATLLSATSAASAITAPEKCLAAKHSVAGGYARCLENAEKSLIISGDSEKYAAAVAKCASTFSGKWQAAEDKAAATGSACVTVSDLTRIKGALDENSDCLAMALTGDSSCLTCGNGTIENGEDCDFGTLGGADCSSATGGAQPGGTVSCGGGCQFDTSACSICPGGPGTCSLVCGDNDAGPTEVCDGTDLNGETCVSLGFTDGTLSCAAGCNAFDTSSCSSAVCGNATADGTEDCDGSDLAGESCATQGQGSGTLTCSASCTFNYSSCSGNTAEAEPNDSIAQAAANGIDLNGNPTVEGSIGTAGDGDYFRMTLAADSVVHLETFTSNGDCAPGVSTTLRLYDAGAVLLQTDQTSGIASCSAITVALQAGTYYVKVESGNGVAIAGYILEALSATETGLESEPNDTSATANTNLSGGARLFVFGQHPVASDSDMFSLSLTAATSALRVELIEGGVETCEGNSVDSRVTLYNSAVASLVDDDDDGRGYCSKIDGSGSTPFDGGAANLPPGTYYLQVRSSASAAGSSAIFDYRLVVIVR